MKIHRLVFLLFFLTMGLLGWQYRLYQWQTQNIQDNRIALEQRIQELALAVATLEHSNAPTKDWYYEWALCYLRQGLLLPAQWETALHLAHSELSKSQDPRKTALQEAIALDLDDLKKFAQSSWWREWQLLQEAVLQSLEERVSTESIEPQVVYRAWWGTLYSRRDTSSPAVQPRLRELWALSKMVELVNRIELLVKVADYQSALPLLRALEKESLLRNEAHWVNRIRHLVYQLPVQSSWRSAAWCEDA